MALPDSFSSWEHLQSVLMQVQNRIVRKEFADVGDDNWDEDIVTPRGSLRVACTLRDTDSALETLCKIWLFYGLLKKAKDFHPDIFGIPVQTLRSERRFKPQIQLYFCEDVQDVDPDYDPVDGTISFRLMNQTSTTLSLSEAQAYANRIRTAFAGGGGFVWRKGKLMASYTDWDRGYQLQLLVRDKSEARRLVEQVLDVQQHTPDWKYLNVNENEEASTRYPIVPPNRVILGKSRRMARQRPIADVRFAHATLHMDELPSPLVLVDRVGRYRQALVEL